MELTPKKPTSPDLRGMLSTRQGMLAVATTCALIAGGIIVFAISRYQRSVSASTKQSTVLVAKAVIQKGTPGDAVATGGLFTAESIVAKQVSAGALADAAALRGKVAVRDILPGEQLTLGDFGAASGIAATLAPNVRAMSISLDQAHGLTGVLQAGDHVDVYGGFDVSQGSGRPRPVMRLLIPNVRVLQAASTGGGIGGGTQAGNAVLAINDSQSGKIAFAQENGKIWLVLRPGNAASTPPTFDDLGSELLGSTPIQDAALNRSLVAALVARASQ
jgi:Flp pilus assembly protein CpaB